MPAAWRARVPREHRVGRGPPSRIDRVQTNNGSERVIVDFNPSQIGVDQMRRAIRNAGYRVEEGPEAGSAATEDAEAIARREAIHNGVRSLPVESPPRAWNRLSTIPPRRGEEVEPCWGREPDEIWAGRPRRDRVVRMGARGPLNLAGNARNAAMQTDE